MTTFTMKSVEKMIRAGGKDKTYTEDAPRGTGRLGLRIREERGSAEWRFIYFVEGKRKAVKIANAVGPGKLSLLDARTKVEKLRRYLVDGLDPQNELARLNKERRTQERVSAERGSVEQLFQEYVDDLKRRGKSSWKAVESALLTGRNAAVDELGEGRKAADITPLDIRVLLRKTYNRGAKSMASHLRAYLNGAFKFGIGHEHDYTRTSQDVSFGLDSNPVAAIPVDREARRVGERVLNVDEIKSVWFDMGKHGATPQIHNAVKLIIATGGQRVREVVEARISEFNLENMIWSLPGERTKNGRDHPIPLTELAVEIVRECLERNDSEYLFPNARDTSKPMTFAAVGQAVTRYCTRAEIEHWTPRDIRRTARTMLADAREPRGRLDIHFNHGTTVGVGEKHYEKAERLKDKVVTMAKWEQLLSKALGIKVGKLIQGHFARTADE